VGAAAVRPVLWLSGWARRRPGGVRVEARQLGAQLDRVPDGPITGADGRHPTEFDAMVPAEPALWPHDDDGGAS
jgi:hypothetical protein